MQGPPQKIRFLYTKICIYDVFLQDKSGTLVEGVIIKKEVIGQKAFTDKGDLKRVRPRLNNQTHECTRCYSCMKVLFVTVPSVDHKRDWSFQVSFGYLQNH